MIRVIIVTYNSINEISSCLSSFYKSNCKDLGVTIVDNQSRDETKHFININYPEIEIIETDFNGGYAYANNIGIKKYLESKYETDAFLILNPDAIINREQIFLLYDTFKNNQNIGAVSPWIIEDFKKKRFVKNIFGFNIRKLFDGKNNLLITDMLHGACIMIRPKVFFKIGLFDESFFLYAEETEFCYRACKNGFILLVNSDIKINHSRNDELRVHTIYYMWRNIFILSKKCFSNIYRYLYLFRRLVILPKYLIIYGLAGRLDLIKAMLVGIFDGLNGLEGPSHREMLF